MADPRQGDKIETDIPAGLDRLPWSRWHARIIVALGTSWLLNVLEVTMVGSLAGILESKAGLHLTDPQVTGPLQRTVQVKENQPRLPVRIIVHMVDCAWRNARQLPSLLFSIMFPNKLKCRGRLRL